MKQLSTLVIAIALFAACKKEDKKADPAPAPAPTAPAPTATPTEAPKPTEPSSAPAATAPAPTDPAAAAPARPASVTDEHVALADKLIVSLKDFGKALETAGTDCKAATAAVKAYTVKLKPLMEEAEKVKEATEKDAAAKEWFQKTYAPQMMAAMSPMMKTAQACSNDKEFTGAMDGMQMPGRKVKKSGP